MRRPTFLITLAFGALVLVGPCRAQVFRCPNGNAVTFQQSPCDGLDASGGRLIRSADGRTVRAAEPVASSPATLPAAAIVAPPSPARVYGRTPLPGTDVLRTAKSP